MSKCPILSNAPFCKALFNECSLNNDEMKMNFLLLKAPSKSAPTLERVLYLIIEK